MFILSIIFSGEERELIRETAMMVWEYEQLLGPSVLSTEVKFPN
jgi:hypothetical protein